MDFHRVLLFCSHEVPHNSSRGGVKVENQFLLLNVHFRRGKAVGWWMDGHNSVWGWLWIVILTFLTIVWIIQDFSSFEIYMLALTVFGRISQYFQSCTEWDLNPRTPMWPTSSLAQFANALTILASSIPWAAHHRCVDTAIANYLFTYSWMQVELSIFHCYLIVKFPDFLHIFRFFDFSLQRFPTTIFPVYPNEWQSFIRVFLFLVKSLMNAWMWQKIYSN